MSTQTEPIGTGTHWTERIRPWQVAIGLVCLARTLAARWVPGAVYDQPWSTVFWCLALIGLAPAVPEAWVRAWRRSWRLVVAVAVAFVAIFVLENLVWPTVRTVLVGKVDDGNTASVLAQYGGSRPLLALVVMGIGPVVEEFVYRYVLFGVLTRVNVVLAYVVSSFAFGLQHVLTSLLHGDAMAWWNLPGYAIFGLGLCAVYRHERTLVAPWLVHVLNNALVLLVV